MKNRLLKGAALIPALLCLTSLTSCNEQTIADTVVYSKVYTSNASHDYAEAFAVKDGKYVYVGTKEGAQAYIKKGKTTVLDRSGGFIMSGATEGHGHYVMASVLASKDLMFSATTLDDDPKTSAVVFAKQVIARDSEKKEKVYFTYGWSNEALKAVKATTDMRSKLDAICPDKPLFLIDDSGHNVFMNSKAIEGAKIDEATDPDWSIAGGTVARDADGRLLGLATDIAMNYVLNAVLKPAGVLSESDFASALKHCEKTLHSYGYTNYLDAYTSYFGDCAYSGISAYDKGEGLDIYMAGSYKIDAYENIEKQVDKAAENMEKYTTTRFQPNNIKVFADGECFENKSAWVYKPYKNTAEGDEYGTQVWQDEDINKLVKRANSKGVSVHAHASGDHAVDQMVNAYIGAESSKQGKIVNSIGHTCHVTDETLDKMAAHKIPSATNICWRIKGASYEASIKDDFDYDYYMESYPMKRLFDKGVVMASSTDYPANSGAPCDILNIMQIATSGTISSTLASPDKYFSLDKSECITLQQAIEAFTINGAKELGIEETRGSVEVGKYADFVYLDKDITSCANITDATIAEVYFEGGLTYTGPTEI